MTPEAWAAVDGYIEAQLIPPDPALKAALQASEAAGLPPIQVPPAQGKLLQILAGMVQARNILEIGTLAGYSTIWLARALPKGGRLITLEADPEHAEVARANLSRAGVSAQVQVRVGLAADSLRALAAESPPPFDFVFIDADKESTADYFDWALRLTRPGAAIVVDNVIRRGALVDEASSDPRVRGMRRFFERAGAEPRVRMTAIQTVGAKGYDGFAVGFVVSAAPHAAGGA